MQYPQYGELQLVRKAPEVVMAGAVLTFPSSASSCTPATHTHGQWMRLPIACSSTTPSSVGHKERRARGLQGRAHRSSAQPHPTPGHRQAPAGGRAEADSPCTGGCSLWKAHAEPCVGFSQNLERGTQEALERGQCWIQAASGGVQGERRLPYCWPLTLLGRCLPGGVAKGVESRYGDLRTGGSGGHS